jgi:hypothetical protein
MAIPLGIFRNQNFFSDLTGTLIGFARFIPWTHKSTAPKLWALCARNSRGELQLQNVGCRIMLDISPYLSYVCAYVFDVVDSK